MTRIARVYARQILDSRGRPTVEVDVSTDDGTLGRAAVPSGASTGSMEALELRDGSGEYAGRGVRTAVSHVNDEIASAAVGHEVREQAALDKLLVELDGTANLGRLGANAILGVSLAACRAAAYSQRMPLHEWVAALAGTTPSLPMPMVNILSGGLHAGRGMDVQDFLAVPAAADALAARGLPTLLADEGGLAPGLETGRAALELMIEAIDRAGLTPGLDVVLAIDVAAHALWDAEKGGYHLAREGRYADGAEMVDMLAGWAGDFPVASIEDALDEEDWPSWSLLTERLGDRLNLVGDDLFVTNLERLKRGIQLGAANGILVKVNQNGTLSGTLDVIAAARAAGYVAVVSARSGETEDSFISDLAVGAGVGQIKIGSVRSSERLAKYNQLLRIAEDPALSFARMTGYPRHAQAPVQ